MDLIDAARIFGGAMTPVGELRFSIPYGVLGLDAPWPAVLLLSIVGNMVPVVVLLPLLDRIALLLERYPNPVGRMLRWRVQHLQAKHQKWFLRWGAPALVLFVGVPLPLTGAWTGTLVAWAFRVPYRQAVPLIGLGVIIAGVIVTVLTVGGAQVGGWLLGYGS